MSAAKQAQAIAAAATGMIVKSAIGNGMSTADVMVILENVIVGVMLAVAREQDDQTGVKLLAEGARERLPHARKALRSAEGRRILQGMNQ